MIGSISAVSDVAVFTVPGRTVSIARRVVFLVSFETWEEAFPHVILTLTPKSIAFQFIGEFFLGFNLKHGKKQWKYDVFAIEIYFSFMR